MEGQMSFEGMPEPPQKKSPAFPKRALYLGKIYRVLYYEGDNVFRLLDPYDCQVSVNTSKFTFLK